jgi:hypothetical protein
MFEQAILTSEAFRQGAPQMQGMLRMAMKGCPQCGGRQMIASPSLGICEKCDTAFQVVDE